MTEKILDTGLIMPISADLYGRKVVEPENHRQQRCAIYQRKSTTQHLGVDFNSLAFQRQICSSYIASQQHKGWIELPEVYQDSGWSGANVDRPAFQRLLSDIEQNLIDVIVVYKMDRLTRSLSDFVRLAALFERQGVHFVSVTQAFDTSDSMGRMVMNIVLTFAQFEREMIADRVRDKIQTMRRRGMWTGGSAPFGYDLIDKKLVVNRAHAAIVVQMFERFVELGTFAKVKREILEGGENVSRAGRHFSATIGGRRLSDSGFHKILGNCVYIGKINCDGVLVDGLHNAIISNELWEKALEVRASRKSIRYRQGDQQNLLMGLIFDSQGRRMLTAVDRKLGKKYRYYVSSNSLWAKDRQIPRYRCKSEHLENVIVASICDFLGNRVLVRNALNQAVLTTSEIDRLATFCDAACEFLAKSDVHRRRQIFLTLVSRCELFRDHVDVQIRCSGVARILEWDGISNFEATKMRWRVREPVIVISIPVTVSVSIKSLVVPLESSRDNPNSNLNEALVALVNDARFAQNLIFNERESSMAELATRMNMTDKLFSRLVRLNYLSPDIIAAILDGRQPAELTREKILYADLPMDWSVQRRMLGFE